jgi:hypothetical protein
MGTVGYIMERVLYVAAYSIQESITLAHLCALSNLN